MASWGKSGGRVGSFPNRCSNCVSLVAVSHAAHFPTLTICLSLGCEGVLHVTAPNILICLLKCPPPQKKKLEILKATYLRILSEVFDISVSICGTIIWSSAQSAGWLCDYVLGHARLSGLSAESSEVADIHIFKHFSFPLLHFCQKSHFLALDRIYELSIKSMFFCLR